MSEEEVIRVIVFVPEGITPDNVMLELSTIIGLNVRIKAHNMWHEMAERTDLSPTERTVILAQMQAFLDYADEVDPLNVEVSEFLKREFGWALP